MFTGTEGAYSFTDVPRIDVSILSPRVPTDLSSHTKSTARAEPSPQQSAAPHHDVTGYSDSMAHASAGRSVSSATILEKIVGVSVRPNVVRDFINVHPPPSSTPNESDQVTKSGPFRKSSTFEAEPPTHKKEDSDIEMAKASEETLTPAPQPPSSYSAGKDVVEHTVSEPPPKSHIVGPSLSMRTAISTVIDQAPLHLQPLASGKTTSSKLPRKDSGKLNPAEAVPPKASGDANKLSSRASKYKHASAIHTESRSSPLTTGNKSIPSYDGFRNLMLLVILVSNLRLMMENFKKYGVLICVGCHDYRRQDLVLGALLFFSVPFHLFFAYVVELFAATVAKFAMNSATKAKSPEVIKSHQKWQQSLFRTLWYLVAFAHTVNATANLAIASVVVYSHIHHPGIGTLCEMHAVIVWLKTCSYAFTNRDLRNALLYPTESSLLPDLYATCPYPRNITLSNLTYFWWAPTLIYQPVYPRTSHIRWTFVFKRLLEILGLSIAIWIASAQYAVPLLQNSLSSISSLDLASILERLMKLSSISLFCWLCGFFVIFQSALNLLAEITRFADREFYSDWWNSSSVAGYWVSWNKPVHHFVKRHIFLPLVGRGCPPLIAYLIVFTFSGVLHEMLVGLPTHNFIGIAFAGMMFQLPLMVLTELITRKVKGFGGRTAGNVIFWVSFVLVGQPLAALLYFFAWQAKYGSVSPPEIRGLLPNRTQLEGLQGLPFLQKLSFRR